MVRTIKRRNRPRRFHTLVEIREDWRTPVVHLSVEPPRDPINQVPAGYTDYNGLTSGEAKETHRIG